MLRCDECGQEHDLDVAPDEGACLGCGGPLVEDDEDASDRDLGPILEQTATSIVTRMMWRL